jgi:adenine-specific DNA methylase
MKTLSLKLDDDIFNETEILLTKVKKSRNRYINEAVDYYNRINNRNFIARKLVAESKIVRKESLAVLAEFESLNDENQAI